MKRCFKCNQIKSIDKFYSHKQMGDGRLGKCKACCISYQKNRDNRPRDSKRYRESIKRLLQNRYLTMSQRASGKFCKRGSTGKEIVSKDDFFKWSSSQMNQIMKLHKSWKESGFNRNLAPSIDRIDSKKGYTIGNMQWITCHENTCKR